VPRAGNERAIGFNVLNYPAYRPGAEATIQRRVLTVAGPLPLYRGEPGIVARVPVFQRGRDGRDYFWGFVAASMRLSEALSRAKVDALARQGYCYAFFAPASGKQQGATIAASGTFALQSAVQHPVRLQDLEFRLALLPRGGWVSKTRVALESLGVLAASGLLCLLVNSLGSRRAVERALAEANQRLARETAERKQAREDCRNAKDEAAAVRAELDRARSAVQSSSELEARLAASERAAEQAMQARQAELAQARAAQQQAEQTIPDLQARLKAAARAEKQAAADLQTRVEAAQATIADLQARLEAATRLGVEAAEASPARSVQAKNTRHESSVPPAENDVTPSSPSTEPGTVPSPVTNPEPGLPASPMPEVTPAKATPPPPQPPANSRPPRVARRKKTRRDGQMDFFEAQTAASQTQVGLAADVAAQEPAVETPSLRTVEPPTPTATSASVEPATPAAAPSEPILTASKTAPKPKEEKPARPLPAPPPVDSPQLRKAVNLILPLFTGQDPGARDCLKANRATFRSAFAPEAFVEFEQSVKDGDFTAALEHLRKAGRRHGIPV
jgi:hypothetical protein